MLKMGIIRLITTATSAMNVYGIGNTVVFACIHYSKRDRTTYTGNNWTMYLCITKGYCRANRKTLT